MTEPQSENQRLRGRKDLDRKLCWLCNDSFGPRSRAQHTCYNCLAEFRQFRRESPRRFILYGLHHLAARIAVLERAVAQLKEAKDD